jgi:hypothetical protein
MYLSWEMTRHKEQNTRILLKDYCGVLRHVNKTEVCIEAPYFPDYYALVLEDKTLDISGSLDIKKKSL